ncbi:hypothetical protein GCM10007276_08410 [Agaricicola taiwanensis]|uniref:Uncharacterized protein n=1 Tax=Agaricicola taiwanensis TaxID=591372 RepID=A0A8J2VMJ4_9RHOB|nr:hypothetical protein GCM10007276_08410 [Agaricicola taiwanensis]
MEEVAGKMGAADQADDTAVAVGQRCCGYLTHFNLRLGLPEAPESDELSTMAADHIATRSARKSPCCDLVHDEM